MTTPELVFLHIPKTAGTSQRRSFAQYYGRENIFWIGDDCPGEVRDYPARELQGRLVVGGHKPLSFYPRRLDALYCAVLRDPVHRAISLFSYYTQPESAQTALGRQTRAAILERMRKQGMNPDSMLGSIRDCQAFRREISNVQCGYLSRSRKTFKGALHSLRKNDFILGSLNEYNRFHQRLGELLGWPDEEPGALNLSKANYESGYLGDPELVAQLRELNEEDYKLTQFLHREHDDLYVNLRNPARRQQRLGRLTIKPWRTALARQDWRQIARQYWPARDKGSSPWPSGQVLICESRSLMYVSIPGPADPAVRRMMLACSAVPHRDAALGLGLGRVLSNFNTGLMLRDHSQARVDELLADRQLLRFALLQDPITRLLDVYVQKFAQQRADLARTPRLAALVRVFHADASTPLEDSISFREFVTGILGQKPHEQHPLWARQSLYLEAVGGCDRLYRQDRIEVLRSDLEQLRGITGQFPETKTGTCPGAAHAAKSVLSDGEYADCRAHALPSDTSVWRDRLVDERLAEQILSYYAQDCDLYNDMADKGKLVINQ